MRNLFAYLFALCISLCSLAQPSAARADELKAWEKTQERLKREAIELFRVVLHDDKDKPAACEFRTKWFEYSIPAQYFGSQILADLAPLSVADPAEIMDPSGLMPEAFCDEANDELRLSFLVENLRRRELRDEKDPTRNLNSLEIYRREYTFPIFGKNYTRAVVVSSNERRFWYWHPKGQFRPGIESDIGALVYEKRKGRWRFIKYQSIASGHG